MVSYEHKVKNIYLGEPWWSPGENTVLYMPFNNDLLDHSNNNIQFTNTNTVLENNTAYFNGSANLINSSFTTYLNQAPFTCSVRVKSKTFNDGWWIVSATKWSYSTRNWWNIAQIYNNWNKYRAEMTAWWSSATRQIFTLMNLNEWDLLTYVKTTTELKFYKNAVLVDSQSANTGNFQNEFSIWQWRWNTSNTSEWKYFNWWMSELILESKGRTAEEIENYYNQIKSNYGIS